VVDGVAHQVHERVADLLDHGLVELGVGAADDELDLLAELARDVAHHAREAVEDLADRRHAQAQRAVAHILDQTQQVGGDLVQRAAVGALGLELGGRAGDHQLAHLIDERIEPVGRHLDALGLAVAAPVRRLLLAERGLDHARLHGGLVDQQLADRRCGGRGTLVRERTRQFALGDRAAGDEDLAQSARVLVERVDEREVVVDARIGRHDGDGGVILRELEHRLDLGLGGRAAQRDLEAEVAGFRVAGGQLRQRVDQGFDVDELAERAQVVDEGERVHAVAQHIAAKAQRKVPVLGSDRDAARRVDLERLRHRRRVDRRRQRRLRPPRAGATGRVAEEPQAREQGFAFVFGQRRRVGHRAHEAGDVVLRLEQQVDELVAECDLAVAQAVEHVLDHVGEVHHRIEPEQTGRALDRVGAAEQGVHVLGGERHGFGAQQDVFHLREQVAAFVEKGGQSLRQIHRLLLGLRPGAGDQQRVAERTAEVGELEQAQDRIGVIDEAHRLARAALGHEHELQAGGVDFGDAAEVDLELVVRAERLQPVVAQRGDGVDAELALRAQAHGAGGGLHRCALTSPVWRRPPASAGAGRA